MNEISLGKIGAKKKAFVLLEITKELVRQSGGEITRLKNVLDEEREEKQKKKEEAEKIIKIPEISAEKEKRVPVKIPEKTAPQPVPKRIAPRPMPMLQPSIMSKREDEITKMISFENQPSEIPEKRPLFKPGIRRPSGRILRIPAPKLPRGFEHLKPMPVTGKSIDLGKLNPLIKDPNVMNIEINGPDDTLKVDGPMGKKNTNIVLTGEEIDDIVERFSSATKIPANEGIYRVVFGNLMFLAIISKVIGSKFIIRKITNPQPRQPMPFNQKPINPVPKQRKI